VEGFEDEDMELQAALQASLMDGAAIDFSLSLPRGSSSGQQTGARTPTQQRSLPPMAAHPPAELQSLPLLGFPRPQQQADDPDGPVAASTARNRAIMDRMRREQEIALREQYEEEAARIHGAGADVSLGVDTGISTRTRRARRTRADEEEEDMIRRAIEESRANSGSSSSSPVIVDDDEEAAEVDDGMMIVSDDEDEEYRPQVTRIPPPVPPGAHVSALSYPSHRVYDDDDAELQAALKASLESVPNGFTIPDPPPLPVAPPPTSVSTPGMSSVSTPSERGTEDDEVTSQASTETSQAQEPQVSVDEMRRRRLARFGG